MDQLVKQRVVGAVVLVALAVIFIPVLLEGPEETRMPEMIDIPQPMNDLREGTIRPLEKTLAMPPEVVTTVVIEEPQVDVKTAEKPAPSSAPKPLEKAKPALVGKPESKPKPKPAPKPEPTPVVKTKPVPVAPGVQGWVVQVGSFGKESNAMALRDKLRKAGLAAFVGQIKLPGGTTYRVRVGPEVDKTRSEAQQKKIAREHGINGRVMSHP